LLATGCVPLQYVALKESTCTGRATPDEEIVRGNSVGGRVMPHGELGFDYIGVDFMAKERFIITVSQRSRSVLTILNSFRTFRQMYYYFDDVHGP
jgi:hypothetical protein